MATPRARYNLAAGRPYTTSGGEEKKEWVRFGRMTEWDDGSFSFEFSAIPCGSWWDGKAKAFPADEDRGQQRQQSGPQRQAPAERPQRTPQPQGDSFQDDDIPF